MSARKEMSKYRKSRINDSVAQETAQIIRDVKDPRVSGAMISITGAEVTPDLKYAKIFFSVLGEDGSEAKKGLESAAGFIRGQLAKRLNLRQTPSLSFVHDVSIEHGADIAGILKTITFSDLPGEGDDSGEDGDQ